MFTCIHKNEGRKGPRCGGTVYQIEDKTFRCKRCHCKNYYCSVCQRIVRSGLPWQSPSGSREEMTQHRRAKAHRKRGRGPTGFSFPGPALSSGQSSDQDVNDTNESSSSGEQYEDAFVLSLFSDRD
eukprot:1075105-Rhodomonas_salina.2